jgi:hypothetical protein
MSDPHGITLALAAEMTKAYREANINNIKASAFSKEAYERLLSQDGCVGIRNYMALTTEVSHPGQAGKLTLVMVGYDINGNDMEDKELAERGSLCPDICPSLNSLNS